jgi:RHS repeat-associated protein
MATTHSRTPAGDPVTTLLGRGRLAALRRGVARLLLLALGLESAPALAAEVRVRETPRGWAAVNGALAGLQHAAERWSDAAADDVRSTVEALGEARTPFARALSVAANAGAERLALAAAAVVSEASGSGSGEGEPAPTEDPFGLRDPEAPRAPANLSPPPTPPDAAIPQAGLSSPARASAAPSPSLAATAPESAAGTLALAGGEAALAGGSGSSLPPFGILPGFNLLSIPAPPASSSPASVLAPIAGQYTRVFAFENCSATDPWKLYDPANPGGSDLAAITPAIGFWLEATAATALPPTGPAAPSTTISLCPGWNLIGYPSEFPRSVSAVFAPIAGKYLRVFGFDPSDAADPWEVHDVAVPDWANDLRALVPGRGYWIYATQAVSFPIENRAEAPEVEIVSPADLDEIVGPVPVVGTVRSEALASWQLFLRPEGATTDTLLASGTTPVEAATLATLDPTLLLNGLATLRLVATDETGQQVEDEIAVELEGQRKIGVFTVSFVDLEVPVAGLPLQLVRTYDTRRKATRGDFGHGWTLEIASGSYRTNGPAGTGWRIADGFLPCQTPVEARGHRATIRLSDGEVYRFRGKLTAIAPTLGGCFATYAWEFVDGPEPGSTLEVLGDANVFWANAARDLVYADSQLLFDPTAARLRTRDGRLVELDRARGVTKLGDPNGNTLTISATAFVHSQGTSVSIVRDALGRIVRIGDAAGNATTFVYDGAGDLATATSPEDETTTFRYLDHALVEAEDPRGEIVLRNVYGPDGRLAQTVDAFGRPILFDHRLSENVEVVTNRLGKDRLYEYDARGNVIREVDELGHETTRTFFDDGLPTTETNPLGETTRYAYDAAKNLTSVTDPLGNVTRFTYDAGGRVLTSTDPRGSVTRNLYDAKGNPTRTTGPSGEATSTSYDARGRVLEELDPLGGRTTYLYSTETPWVDRIRETDALGQVTTFSYDHAGNVFSEARGWTNETGEVESLVTGYRHGPSRRLVATIAPDGTQSRTEYAKDGQVKATIDPLGRRTEMSYDAAGRPLRTTYPDGTYEETGYDAEGRRTSARDRAGRITSYEYDDAGRLTKTIAPDGATSEQVYDAAGRVVETIDTRGKSTFFGYDAAGRRTSVRDHLGHETRFVYDAAGNQVAVTDARGATTSFVYDASGRLVRTVFPDGTQTSTTYDGLGRRTSETDPAGKLTSFGYDALGRLVAVTDALGQVTRYAYDELGNRVAQVDANGRTTRFGYDVQGRQTSRVLPGGAIERFTYDAVGNRTSRIDFRGRTTAYTYDPSTSRLLARTYPDGSQVGFTYTATGRRRSATDARGATVYGYDQRDRLTSLTYPDGRRLDYAYDAAGNRTALTAQVGGRTLTTAYTYDDLNRLETVTDPAGKVYVHAYDQNGNRQSLDFPNGVQTGYSYDALNRLKTLITISTATSQTVVSFAYTLGPAGNRTKIVEHDGTERNFTYDALYRLTDEHVTLAGATRWRNTFTYDPVGNRLRQDRVETTGTSRTVNYGYDERDRLLSESSTDSTAYGWDENGNLISKSGADGAVYEWDFDNRLTKVTLANGTVVEHAYDTDGTRVRTTTTTAGGTPERVDYLVDPWSQTSFQLRGLVVSQVVAESSPSGEIGAFHVRGDDLLATLRPNTSPLSPGVEPWTARYLHAEAIGSIRALSDQAGAVTDRYDFEAFGQLNQHSGADPNAYHFAGEASDPNSGFTYLRARWLDLASGRMVSADPWAGLAGAPSTLHRYTYASLDPLSRVDPSGLVDFTIVGQLFVMAIKNINAAIRSVRFGEILTRGLRNKRWDLFFCAGLSGLTSAGAIPIPHFFIFAQGRGTPAGLRYDIGPNQFQGVFRSFFTPGFLQVTPETMPQVLLGARAFKFAALNQTQFGIWNAFAFASSFDDTRSYP